MGFKPNALTYSFQEQACQLTLAQGLAEYYEKNPEFTKQENFLGQEKSVIQAHDVVHVVFGLGTSSTEELVVETRTFFGCRVGLENYVK